MVKNKVCILVDHPRRDLAGMNLLGEHLAKAGMEVYLTPMNLQLEEIVRIQPDLVVLTGIRKTTEPILRFLREKGVKICALETEGAFYFNEEHMMNIFSKDPDIGNYFDCFFAWGEKISNILRNRLPVDPKQIVTTGTPRFDLKREFFKSEPEQILINTNFAYLSETEEDRARKHRTFGFDTTPFYVGMEEMRAAYIELARYLDQQIGNRAKIVFRPHPFENLDYYSGKFDGTHVELNVRDSINEQLAKSHLTIQNNCTTGIESVMFDIPTFSIGYIYTTYRVGAFEAVSDFSETKEELLTKITGVLDGNYHFEREEKLELVKPYIHNISEHDTSLDLIKDQIQHLLDNRDRQVSFTAEDQKKYSYYQPLSKWVYHLRRGKSIDKRIRWRKSYKGYFAKDLQLAAGLKASQLKGLLSVKIVGA